MLPVTIHVFRKDIAGATGIGTLRDKSMESKFSGTSEVPYSFSTTGYVTDTQDNLSFNTQNNKANKAIEGYHDTAHPEPTTHTSSDKGKVNINKKDEVL
jgi:hypothetical protein